MSRLTPPTTRHHDDPATEQFRREHAQKITEIQVLPIVGAVVIGGVSLADGVTTAVPHRLGKLPIWVGPSVVQGATSTGRIVESRNSATDRTKYVLLTATGWGATITVDVLVI